MKRVQGKLQAERKKDNASGGVCASFSRLKDYQKKIFYILINKQYSSWTNEKRFIRDFLLLLTKFHAARSNGGTRDQLENLKQKLIAMPNSAQAGAHSVLFLEVRCDQSLQIMSFLLIIDRSSSETGLIGLGNRKLASQARWLLG